MQQLFDNLPWTVNEPIREILTMLAEFGFAWCPPPVRRMIEVLFAWGSSLVNELGHKEIVDLLTPEDKEDAGGAAAKKGGRKR